MLDVGTGTGRAAIGLARAGATVTGVDASAEMLDVARARAGAITDPPLNITFDVGDAHALTFPSGYFDVAVSLRVLMQAVAHEAQRERALLDGPDRPEVIAVRVERGMT